MGENTGLLAASPNTTTTKEKEETKTGTQEEKDDHNKETDFALEWRRIETYGDEEETNTGSQGRV